MSHFYLDAELRMRAPNYQRNVDVMAMSIVWDERRTVDAECYGQMHGLSSLAGRRVLVVEDHPECAELFKMILEEEGCEVKCVMTGTAGLELFASATPDGRAKDFDPDLTLLDLRLPDMSGADFVEELRRRQPTIPPIVMISAEPRESLFASARRVGVVGVRKPFDFVTLFAAIAAAQFTEQPQALPKREDQRGFGLAMGVKPSSN
jgi:DNA-binding response OmpR family regulator